jgi:hypothetical protein
MSTDWPGTIGGTLHYGVETQSKTPRHAVGSRYVLDDRVFRYCHIKKGINVLGRGSVCVSYNNASTEKGASIGTITKGTSIVGWTVIGNGITKDQYADGYILMQGGFVKSIKSHGAAAKGIEVKLNLKDPITQEDASSGNYGILCEGLYSNVMERTFGNTGPGLIVGVPVADFTTDYYAWLQTWGPCGVIGTAPALNDTAQVTGIVPGRSSGEAVQNIATNSGMVQEERIIGYHIPYNTDNWDDEGYRMLFLTISP